MQIKRGVLAGAACGAVALMSLTTVSASAGTPATLRVEYTFDSLNEVTTNPPTATVVFRIDSDTSSLTDPPNITQKGFYGDVAQWKMQLRPDVADQFTGEVDYVALAVGDGAAAVSRAGAATP